MSGVPFIGKTDMPYVPLIGVVHVEGHAGRLAAPVHLGADEDRTAPIPGIPFFGTDEKTCTPLIGT